MRDCHLKNTNDRVLGHIWALTRLIPQGILIYKCLIYLSACDMTPQGGGAPTCTLTSPFTK